MTRVLVHAAASAAALFALVAFFAVLAMLVEGPTP